MTKRYAFDALTSLVAQNLLTYYSTEEGIREGEGQLIPDINERLAGGGAGGCGEQWQIHSFSPSLGAFMGQSGIVCSVIR